jgi:hypothetical protein
MVFFELVIVAVLGWVSGACFGVWYGGRSRQPELESRPERQSQPQLESQPRRQNTPSRRYFDEEVDRWRPFRRLARHATTAGLVLVALMVTIAFVAFLTQAPKGKGYSHRPVAHKVL